MPSVYIDASDVLDDLSDTDLLEECRARGLLPDQPDVPPLTSRQKWEMWSADVQRAAREREWTALHLLLQDAAPQHTPPKNSLVTLPGLRN